MFLFKVVLGKSVAEVAQNVIKHVRLALLTPEELKQVEQENEKDRMIPVGTREKIMLLIKRFCQDFSIYQLDGNFRNQETQIEKVLVL